ncbi:MAG: M28 family peptidase [Pegethrix bostrychoides GSE-TBD4-15B]|jgi:Iap family predicted aminopeptidase|uniref:M28 family peptidase n=1 Tax=Pegethrix bostrychoides GSE-TBD4-15B TaxID=2839662 RepID=A0A951PCK8_9CYAN|nr:M28 family peptidase [Pegethrix bostrychoides GSE-TBD4-15B]
MQPTSSRSQLIQLKPRPAKLIAASLAVLGLSLTGCSQSAALIGQTIGQTVEQAIDQHKLPLTLLPTDTESPSTESPSSAADVDALVAIGARVAGTPASEQASRYLEAEFRQAGYVTEIQPFSYSKFVDRGSSLTVEGSRLTGRALNGSIPGNLTARLVAVPGVGRSEDFAQVNSQGAIAVVQRGEIRFLDKANNAAAAGAVGLVIVNRDSNNFRGTLGGEATIPVLSLGGEAGQSLSSLTAATLAVNVSQETVSGRNVIARMAGVTQPNLLLGAHYDSVAGSPGANDNASGTGVLLDLARQLSATPLSRQAWFVAFDGEEDGLQGSRAFVRQAQPQWLSQLSGMFNFDMVGVNADLQVSGTAQLTQLATDLAKTELAKTGASIQTIDAAGASDHAAFAAADVPVLFFTRGLEPNYHSPHDRQVNAQLLNQTTQFAIAVLERLLASNS